MGQSPFAERGDLFSLGNGALWTLVRECYFVNGPSVGSGAVTRGWLSRMQMTGEISRYHALTKWCRNSLSL